MSNTSEALEHYEGIVRLVQAAHRKLSDEIIPRVAELLTSPVAWALPSYIRDPFIDGVSAVYRYLTEIEQRLLAHITSIGLPVRLWVNADGWTAVNAAVTAVAGDLDPVARPIQTEWKGAAADAYQAIVPSHIAAAKQLGAAAGAVAAALDWAAMSAALFYAAVLAVVTSVIGAIVGGLFAAGTVVLAGWTIVSWGIAIPAALASLVALVDALIENYGRATIWMNQMVTRIGDRSAFPNGQWPPAAAERYADATVADGDPSDWAVAH